MNLSTSMEVNAVTILGAHDGRLEQVSQAFASMFLCNSVMMGARFERAGDTRIQIEDRGRTVCLNSTAESISAMLGLVATADPALPVDKAAARGLMQIFGIQNEDDIALGLSLCPTKLKLCLRLCGQTGSFSAAVARLSCRSA